MTPAVTLPCEIPVSVQYYYIYYKCKGVWTESTTQNNWQVLESCGSGCGCGGGGLTDTSQTTQQ